MSRHETNLLLYCITKYQKRVIPIHKLSYVQGGTQNEHFRIDKYMMCVAKKKEKEKWYN